MEATVVPFSRDSWISQLSQYARGTSRTAANEFLHPELHGHGQAGPESSFPGTSWYMPFWTTTRQAWTPWRNWGNLGKDTVLVNESVRLYPRHNDFNEFLQACKKKQ